MNRYLKISAALAAFALLLVVMGLSTQGTAQAVADGPLSVLVTSDEGATTTLVSSSFICSQGCTSGEDDVFTVSVDPTPPSDNQIVTIHNLDLATVREKIDPTPSDTATDDTYDGPNANPKTVPLNSSGDATVTAVHKSSGLMDDREQATYEVKAFNGNRIQISHTPDQQLGRRITLVVDNVDPSILINSPSLDLVTKTAVSVTYSADITDGGAGYAAKAADVLKSNTHEEGALTSVKGRIQLFVGAFPVALKEADFEAIDGGWRVTKTVNSSDIANLGDKTPWYFTVEDLAGNRKESTGNLKGKTSGGGADTGFDLVAGGYGSSAYPVNAFVGRSIKYTTPEHTVDVGGSYEVEVGGGTVTFTIETETRTDTQVAIGTAASFTTPKAIVVSAFARTNGTFTLGNVEANAFMPDVTVTGTIPDQDTDDGETGDAATSDPYSMVLEGTDKIVRAIPSGTTFEIQNSHLVTVDGDPPTLETIVTGHAWSKNKNQVGTGASAKSIKVVFADGNGSGLNKSTVSSAAFTVTGNTVESVNVQGDTVYLTLGAALGSTERPTVSIRSGVIADRAGNAFGGRQSRAVDGLGPNLSLAKDSSLSNDKVKVTITTDEQLDGDPIVTVKRADTGAGKLATATVTGAQAQSTALGYTYTVSKSALAGEAGGEFNVYVTGKDTQNPLNVRSVGHKSNAAHSRAFTFELDQRLNNGEQPEVSVSDKTAVAVGSTLQKVEAVDPMIVTVDFSDETNEYSRDSYNTVELLSAKLVISFADGTSETTNFNLTTEISSPDNKRYTIPLLNPKVGTYTLTVTGVDQAGNNTLEDQTATDAQNLVSTWLVIPAKPVAIELKPGWNLVSLPFQPGNPAINSVIPASHPADIVMTYDNATQVWLVSRRDAETGLFIGDIVVMTASTAYFIRTDNFQKLSILRPPVATAAAAPPPPPAITVVQGWNLVPVVSNSVPIPTAIAAEDYFGTLNAGASAGWLKALTFDTLVRTWVSVTPGETLSVGYGDKNPCTGRAVGTDSDKMDNDKVEDGTELCIARDGFNDKGGTDNAGDGIFNEGDTVTLKASVTVGKGYWLYSTVDGVIIP